MLIPITFLCIAVAQINSLPTRPSERLDVSEIVRVNCGGGGAGNTIPERSNWIKTENTTVKKIPNNVLHASVTARFMGSSIRYTRGPSLKYAIPISKSVHNVAIKVGVLDTSGDLVMDISVNGRARANVDVVKLAGGRRRMASVHFPSVHGPTLQVELRRVKGDPAILGIVVAPRQALRPKPEPAPQGGGSGDSKFPAWTGGPSGASRDFGTAPPAGVHPRVWFGPAELPKLRRLLNSEVKCDDADCTRPDAKVLGAGAFAYLKLRLRKGRYNEPLFGGKSKYSKLYDVLKTGSTSEAALNQLKGLGKDIGYDQVAKGGQGYNGMYGLLAGAGFVALVEEDAEFKRKELATVLSTVCVLHAKFYSQINRDWFHHDAQVDLALGYDFMASYMTEAQRKPCRELIFSMIKGRVELGQKKGGYLSAPWRTNWNHIGWHEHIVVMAMAIYGEPGTNGEPQRFLDQCLEVQKNWWYYGVSEGGFGREEIYYFNLGLMWAQPAQLAIARHGKRYNLVQHNELGRTRIYRELLYHFYTKTIPGTTFLSFSGGNNPPRAQIMWMYFWPNDPLAHYNVQNGHKYDFWIDNTLQMATFATEPMKQLSYKEVATAKKLPLSWICRDRGRMIARSTWEDDAMTLDFELRTDAHRTGHVASQPNAFYLYALGLPWIAKDDMMMDGWESSSLVLIDGKGPGGWESRDHRGMMPGVWNEYTVKNGITLGSADAAVPYSFEMNCLANTKCVPNPGFKAKDFTLKTDKFYQPWMEESAGYKTLSVVNPMQYAHRTAMLVRAAPLPFALVIDDYKKDETKREYTWYANVPNGQFQYYMSAKVVEDSSSKNELILKHEGGGDARLLVRLLDWEGTINKNLELAQQTVRNARTGNTQSRRVVTVTTKGTAGRFKLFFFAYMKGNKLPVTQYDRSTGILRVDLESEVRRFKCPLSKDGRTVVNEL